MSAGRITCYITPNWNTCDFCSGNVRIRREFQIKIFPPIFEEKRPDCETYITRTQKRNSGENLNVLAVKYEGECGLQGSIKSCKCKGDKNVGKVRFKWVKKVSQTQPLLQANGGTEWETRKNCNWRLRVAVYSMNDRMRW